jgi:hypothetical protein
MADVQDLRVARRRRRIWPVVILTLAGLLLIATFVAMIMNIHGSISWPPGNITFGFPPRGIETPAVAASPAQPATDVRPAIAPADPAAAPEPVRQAQSVEDEPAPPPISAETPTVAAEAPVVAPEAPAVTAETPSVPADTPPVPVP